MDRLRIERTYKLLPLTEMGWEKFELLCLGLVMREGYTRARHKGASSQDQGIDISAYKPTDKGEQLWYFQCKCYKQIYAIDLKDELDKIHRLATKNPEKKPYGIVFMSSAVLSHKNEEQVRSHCQKLGYEMEFWMRTEMNERIWRHWDLLNEHFDPSLVQDEAKRAYDDLKRNINRNAQVQKFNQAISDCNTDWLKRPRVCVTRGNIKESHDHFLERLHYMLLEFQKGLYPKRLDLPPTLPLQVKLPLKHLKDNNWKKMFWDALKDALTRALSVGFNQDFEKKMSPDTIIEYLSAKDWLVLCDASLRSKDFEGVSPSKLSYFFKFWDQEFLKRWETSPRKAMLVTYLRIEYWDQYETRRRLPGSRKTPGLNADLRQYIEDLEKEFKTVKHIVWLPEFKVVNYWDAKAAVAYYSARPFRLIAENDVNKIYKRAESRGKKGIPMGHLLDRFDKIFTKKLRRGHFL